MAKIVAFARLIIAAGAITLVESARADGVWQPRIIPSPKHRTWLILVLLFVGVISFAVVLNRAEQHQCGPFTIGVSPIGGCDWIVPG
jgi:hypothetical protein